MLKSDKDENSVNNINDVSDDGKNNDFMTNNDERTNRNNINRKNINFKLKMMSILKMNHYFIINKRWALN